MTPVGIIAQRLRGLLTEATRGEQLWGAFPNTMTVTDLAEHVVAALREAGKAIVQLPEQKAVAPGQIIAEHRFAYGDTGFGAYWDCEADGCGWRLPATPRTLNSRPDRQEREDAKRAHAEHVVATLRAAGHEVVSGVRDEWKHQVEGGGGSIHQTREDVEGERESWEKTRAETGGYRSTGHLMPPSVGIYRRTVTEWEPAADRVAEGGKRGE